MRPAHGMRIPIHRSFPEDSAQGRKYRGSPGWRHDSADSGTPESRQRLCALSGGGASRDRHDPRIVSILHQPDAREPSLRQRSPRALRNVVEEALGGPTRRPCRPQAGAPLDLTEGREQGPVQILG